MINHFQYKKPKELNLRKLHYLLKYLIINIMLNRSFIELLYKGVYPDK